MRIFRGCAVRNLIVLCGVVLVAGISSRAQVGNGTSQSQQVAEHEAELHAYTDVQRQNNENPDEEKAYKDFYKADEPAKKITLGNAFLKKYPKSVYDEMVEVGLMNAYYSNKDWKNVYSTADSALALKPDDVYVLTTVGWIIPHVYDPNDPEAPKLLDTAEQYSKYAIDVIPKMPKPAHMNDAQFADMKDKSTRQAHSALGLVYFRRGSYDLSVKELQEATAGLATPDQTDLFVLGIDLQNLNRFADAADAFSRCGQISGPFQDRCKQSADAANKQAPQSK